jgi:succinate dehydrogenase / fumarate reductase, membrane anchor subunit
MVKHVRPVIGSGLFDWIQQRVTAVIAAASYVYVVGVWVLHPNAGYAFWHDFFAPLSFKALMFFSYIMILWHGWAGMWVVLTDYMHSVFLRRLLLFIFAAVIFAQVALFENAVFGQLALEQRLYWLLSSVGIVFLIFLLMRYKVKLSMKKQ